MPLWASIAIALIIVIALWEINGELSNLKKTSTEEPQNTQADAALSVTEKTIIDHSTIAADFLGFEDHPDLGMFVVRLRITNRTGQKITVFWDDASVNDEMMQMVMSGVPLEILPDKRGSNGYIFYYKQMSIDSFAEVRDVSFKVRISEANTLKDIWTSPEVTVSN